jgi:hypothetical protein
MQGDARMKSKKPYMHFIAIIGAILAVLLFNMFREKPIRIPHNDTHRPLLERLAHGDKQEEVEKGCLDCHNPQNSALPKDHPSNKKCLVCHPER